MSIQINGIDKPKSCFDCPCIDAEFEECAAKEHYLLPKDEYGAVLGEVGAVLGEVGAVLGEVPDWCPITEPQTCDDAVSRQAAIDALNELDVSDGVGISSIACGVQESAIIAIQHLPSVQLELIEKAAYIRGFEQGITQGMIDSQGGKK